MVKDPLAPIFSSIDFSIPTYEHPILPDVTKLIPVDGNLASEFHKRLTKWIMDYDETLDGEHEVGVRLVTFGQVITFHLDSIGYWNPSLMQFAGVCEDGTPVELIQHVSQISILLTKMPRLDPTKPKRRIGFGAASQDDE